MATRHITIALSTFVAVTVASFAAGVYSVGYISGWLKSGLDATSTDANAQASDTTAMRTAALSSSTAVGVQSVELNDKQLASVKVEPVGAYLFPVEKVAVGTIDFDEDITVQVFTPYQGKIVELFAKVGDEVKKDQTLFTIDSPDLLAAASSLIAAAGVLDLTSRSLARLKKLSESRAVSQKDLEQAISDQQTAEGALRAGRDAVRIFGKTDSEVDKIIAERMADPKLVVRSPISGRVTARNAAPGLLVQPGNAPAPYSLDGFRQIIEGLQAGELVATNGAVFLSNMLVIGQTGG